MPPPTPVQKQGAYEVVSSDRASYDARLLAWEVAGVGKRHHEKRDTGPVAWLEKRDFMIDRLGTGFIVALLGDRGTGKTQLAVEVIRSHIQNSVCFSARYILATEIIMAIKEAYGGDGITERSKIAPFVDCHLLVIDEFHERCESAWENRLMTYIIDKRYLAMRDTIMIANLKEEEFRECAGTSIYSRMVETGGVIEADWDTFRKG